MWFRKELRNCSKVALASVIAIGAVGPSFAAASPVTVKIGYFNLQMVKAANPEAAGSETLRIQAENQLRADVEEGNKKIQKATEDKKPKEEIERMARDLQHEINAKQQALIQIVQTQQQIANQKINMAVAAVAKEKALDVVVDGAGVFAGGDKLVNSGEDITEQVVKRLAPQVLNRPGADAPRQAAPAAPAAK